MKTLTMLTILGLALFSVGCEGSSASTTGAPAPSGSPAVAELKDEDLPVPADFDDEAEKQISPTTYKSELDSLEKEISAP